ncbi:MAG: hypothetical protein HZA49_02930 [Planctomycetes bacterium]|nr:hypothetical protein [Planctomycetota bacterium]
MSTIISKVRLFVPLDLTTIPEHMSNDWRDSLKSKAEGIDKKRKLIIPDEMAYKTKLAGPASEGYSPFPSATFRSKSGKSRQAIVNAHAENVLNTFNNYETKLLRAFEEIEGEIGKRFKESVDNAVDLYVTRVAKRTLPFTGEKTIGKSVTGIAPLWLTDDASTERHIRGADQVLQGGPTNIALISGGIDNRTGLKAALAQQLTKSGVIIVTGRFETAQMSAENDAINAILKGLQDSTTYVPFATGGASHCDYIVVDSKMFLEIQVSIP